MYGINDVIHDDRTRHGEQSPFNSQSVHLPLAPVTFFFPAREQISSFRIVTYEVSSRRLYPHIPNTHIFPIPCSYVDDETSPVFFDPLNPEDYSYSILSKSLVKKCPEVPLPVAGAAEPVREAECSNGTAHQALHSSGMKSRGSEVQASASPVSEKYDSTPNEHRSDDDVCQVGIERSCVKSAVGASV